MENLRALFENEYPGKKVLFESLIKQIFVKANDTTLTDEQELSDSDKKQIKSFSIIAQVRGSFPTGQTHVKTLSDKITESVKF